MSLNTLKIHWKKAATALAVVMLGTGGALAYSTYAASTDGDCCAPGAPCCHPGSPCCQHHNRTALR